VGVRSSKEVAKEKTEENSTTRAKKERGYQNYGAAPQRGTPRRKKKAGKKHYVKIAAMSMSMKTGLPSSKQKGKIKGRRGQLVFQERHKKRKKVTARQRLSK